MAKEQFMIWRHPVQLLIAVTISMILITAIQTFGPSIEGRFFPVAQAYDVDLTVVDADHTEISGTMSKIRDCNFRALEAYLIGPRGNRVFVPMEIKGTLKLRPTGEFDWGPWKLSLPLWQINENEVEIVVYHRCHDLYLTETLFYRTRFDLPPPPFIE